MEQFCITKYNPLFRDEWGRYLKNDWTSYSDIGSEFFDGVLTKAKYEEVENAYIKAAICLLKYAKIESLRVVSLESKYNGKAALFENQDISIRNIENYFRGILRDEFWCRFESVGKTAFVHFGYDYYMYLGVPVINEEQLIKVSKMGLYAERCISPYTLED